MNLISTKFVFVFSTNEIHEHEFISSFKLPLSETKVNGITMYFFPETPYFGFYNIGNCEIYEILEDIHKHPDFKENTWFILLDVTDELKTQTEFIEAHDGVAFVIKISSWGNTWKFAASELELFYEKLKKNEQNQLATFENIRTLFFEK